MEKEAVEKTVYELIVGECDINDCLVKEVQKNLDLLPSNVNLAGAEIELLKMENKESILRYYLNEIKDNYDFIIYIFVQSTFYTFHYLLGKICSCIIHSKDNPFHF